MLDEGVELVLGILVFVSLASDSYADLAGNVSDAVDPDESVEAGVNSDVLGVHFAGGETLDVANATGSSLLELDALEHLVDVDCVVAAGGLHLLFDHLSLWFSLLIIISLARKLKMTRLLLNEIKINFANPVTIFDPTTRLLPFS